ncbi:MAG: hypothetical protein ACHBN1_13500 [Heteroscytonema crispum UTEX LB 1556]
MGRPQDRSGSPTKGAPSPLTIIPQLLLADTVRFVFGFFFDLIDLAGGFSVFAFGGRQRSQYRGCDG